MNHTVAGGSLAYRKHEAAIRAGHVPDKYLRILPFIPTGGTVLEIGAAEGVLSLLLAERDPSARIIALEMNVGRHEAALALQAQWRAMGRRVDGCTMVCGDIRQRIDLLKGVDTFVGVRTIYHLGASIPEVFAAVSRASVRSVVLVGNPNRARWPNSTPSAADAGDFNVYAGVPGMSAVLTSAGYAIGTVVAEGDPIVTGHR